MGKILEVAAVLIGLCAAWVASVSLPSVIQAIQFGAIEQQRRATLGFAEKVGNATNRLNSRLKGPDAGYYAIAAYAGHLRGLRIPAAISLNLHQRARKAEGLRELELTEDAFFSDVQMINSSFDEIRAATEANFEMVEWEDSRRLIWYLSLLGAACLLAKVVFVS